jgi:hypothetical protein
VGALAELIVIVRTAVPDPLAFVAERVPEYVPAVVGTPEITPVVVFSDNPGGTLSNAKLVGLLVAAIWYENEEPTAPVWLLGLMMTGIAPELLMTKFALPEPE